MKARLSRSSCLRLHFTPTYCSRQNRVERWFALITTQTIRRGSFNSVPDFKRRIDEFVKHYNQHRKPFIWTATAESTPTELEQPCKVINGTRH